MSIFKKLFGGKGTTSEPPVSPPERDYSSLPSFKYHPDPLATGSIRRDGADCICCGKATGYIYTGPVYTEDELNEQICPWCIADSYAHKRFGAVFTDEAGIGGYGE